MKKIIFVMFMFTVLSAPASAGVPLFGGKTKKNPAIETMSVKRRDISSSILVTGSVKPITGAEVKVGSRISGKVEHLYANIGNEVEKDQVIAEIEKRDLEVKVAQAEAALAIAEAKLLALGNQRPKAVEIARYNVKGARSALYPSVSGDVTSSYGGITENPQSNALAGIKLSVPLFNGSSNVNIKKAETDLGLTETIYDDNLKVARAEVEQAGAALEYAKVQLSYATIKAPIAGVIASVTTQEGETIAAGLSAPTFVTIIDLSRLEVNAFVDETDIGRVKVGQNAVFTVDTYPDKEFSGKVKAIYPKATIQDNVVYYITLIWIENHEGRLKPDMTISSTISLTKRSNVLAVPNKAIQREGGRKAVQVLENGAAVRKFIKTGWKDGNYTEVLEGVKEGDLVLTGEAPKTETK